MTAIAVVGPGAIGATFAAQLWNAGHRGMLFCARKNLSQWVVESPEGRTSMTPRVATNPASVTPVDWVFFATKAHQTATAGRWLGGLCSRKTRVVVLQNGVEHVERVAPYVGDAFVLPAVVRCPAEQVEPGLIVRRGPVGLCLPDGPDAERLEALFCGTETTIERTADFVSASWEKLAWNSVGGILAITEQPWGVLRRPSLAELAQGMVLETLAVARAEGAELDDTLAKTIVQRCQESDAQRGTSILYDRRARRPLEHDARNGVIVRKGSKHGIPTPLNSMVAALLGAISDSFEADP